MDQFSVLNFNKDRRVPAISLFKIPERVPKEQATLTTIDLECKTRATTWKELKALPGVKVNSPLICQIFNWAEVVSCEGWKIKHVLNYFGISGEENKYYSFHSRDGEYFETLTHGEAMDDRTILAYRMNGEDLSQEHGAPLRLLVPFLQGYKIVKWAEGVRGSE